MRVITGKAKGINLKVPDNVSPITDRVKTVIFDIIGEEIEDSFVLDLFAGSGSIGIEALSRGAEKAFFLDIDQDNLEIVQENLKKTGFIAHSTTKRTDLLEGDYRGMYNNIEQLWIFIDPPFKLIDQKNISYLLSKVRNQDIVILKVPEEFRLNKEVTQNFSIKYDKTIGINRVLIMIPS
jgi:16S rRNA (guanine(966)-N(2))-methyltransferase RsmD